MRTERKVPSAGRRRVPGAKDRPRAEHEPKLTYLFTGNVAINLKASDSKPTTSPSRSAAFVADGAHPHTTIQGLFANLAVEALRHGYGTRSAGVHRAEDSGAPRHRIRRPRQFGTADLFTKTGQPAEPRQNKRGFCLQRQGGIGWMRGGLR